MLSNFGMNNTVISGVIPKKYNLMISNFVIKFIYICHNYQPNGRDYDERGIGLRRIGDSLYAVVERSYR